MLDKSNRNAPASGHLQAKNITNALIWKETLWIAGNDTYTGLHAVSPSELDIVEQTS